MICKNIYKHNSLIAASNKHAYYEYFIEKKIEAGLVLLGWEVKSLRTGRVNINDSYVVLKNKEAFLLGASFSPLVTISSYDICYSNRTRKLLLSRRELDSLYGFINRKGYTAIALSLYWKNSWCKVKIGVARGKKQYDKRYELKEREWQRNKARLIKINC